MCDDMMFVQKIDDKLNVDIVDEKDKIIITADIPGCRREDIDLSLDGELFIITIRKPRANSDKIYLRRERKWPTGKIISRSFIVGKIDKDDIDAFCLDGVLKITIKKHASKVCSKIR